MLGGSALQFSKAGHPLGGRYFSPPLRRVLRILIFCHHGRTRPSTMWIAAGWMRLFGPPEVSHMIAGAWSRRSAASSPGCWTSHKKKDKGETRIDVVDEYAFPGPVTVICKGPGCAAGGPSRASTAGSRAALDGVDFGPEANDHRSQQRRTAAVPAQVIGNGRVQPVPGRPDRPVPPKQPGQGHVLGDGERRRPGGAKAYPESRSSTTRCSCSSPGMRPRST